MYSKLLGLVYVVPRDFETTAANVSELLEHFGLSYERGICGRKGDKYVRIEGYSGLPPEATSTTLYALRAAIEDIVEVEVIDIKMKADGLPSVSVKDVGG